MNQTKYFTISLLIVLVLLPASVHALAYAEPTQEEIEAILEKNNIATVTPETVPAELLKEDAKEKRATSTLGAGEAASVSQVAPVDLKFEALEAKKAVLEKAGQELAGRVVELEKENGVKVFLFGYKKSMLDSGRVALDRVNSNYQELMQLIEQMPDSQLKTTQQAYLSDLSSGYQIFETKLNNLASRFNLWGWIKSLFAQKSVG